MVLQCKKGKLFVTGEVFLLDIGLLMGAKSLKENFTQHTYGVSHTVTQLWVDKWLRIISRVLFAIRGYAL